MKFQRIIRRPVLLAMGVAVIASIVALVFGFSGNLGVMTVLTVVALVAVVAGAILAFRSMAAPSDRRI
jgi:hypothetical protein